MRISIAVLLLASCSSCEDDPPRRRDAGRAEAPREEPPPIQRERVTIAAQDGTSLVGDLVWRRSDAPLVVFVHQLGSTRAEWNDLRAELEDDYTTFAFDLRGHGESTQGGALDFNAFSAADWAKLPGDLDAVLATLDARLDAPRLAIVGSSIGSSAAIVTAAEEPSGLSAVVAISPGRAYHGIDALTPLTRFGDRPILAIASEDDGESAETAANIARIAPSGEVATVQGDVHGVGILARDPSSRDRVLAFLRAHLR